MTKRNPISATQNIWFDAEQVDNTDLTVEQQYNTAIQSAIINNHIGTGIVPENITQTILFDSSLVSDYLDGLFIQTQSQPSDNNYGNQLDIELTSSEASSKRAVKLCVVGLDFQSNLQYETFVFTKNENQISSKHFTKILALLFNDFIGDTNISLNLGGRIVVKEAKPIYLSRDSYMLSQDKQPNLFFRDFFVIGASIGASSVEELLQISLPYYDISSLNITTTSNDQKILSSGDVTTQIGQKFSATTNNIQKISLLLSVRNQTVGHETEYDWTGDLVVSIYSLQTNIENYNDIAPNLAIDYSPSPIPIAQVSFNYNSLKSVGTVLDSVPQPVEFVFSNSSVAGGNVLTVGNYYAFTIKRSGSANKCDILIDSGTNIVNDSRITVYTGSVWVDLPDEDLWFKIYTDSAKITDGQAYDSGNGSIIEKTTLDSNNSTIDNCYNKIQFIGTEVYNAVYSSIVDSFDQVSNPKTGQPIDSKQKLIPNVKLLNSTDLTNLQNTTVPLVVGTIVDKNKKYFDPADITIASKIHGATIVDNEILLRVVTDDTDTNRYDTSVIELETKLLNGDLVNAKIIPNTNTPSIYYRITDASICSMIIGDVNGDGVVDNNDLDLLNSYLGASLNDFPPLNTIMATYAGSTTYTNGYTLLTNKFDTNYNLTFQVLNSSNVVITSGTDGYLVANPSDNRLAQFSSSTVNFNTIIGLSTCKIAIFSSTVGNTGVHDIASMDALYNTVTIRKIFLTGDVIGQFMRADIDQDFYVSSNDGYLLGSYLDRQTSAVSTQVYPGPTSNVYKQIGSKFNVIRLKVQKFEDRLDDYSSTIINRSTSIHVLPDLFESDGYFQGKNILLQPANLSIEKQLSWDESLIISNSKNKLVPSVFTTTSGYSDKTCSLEGIICNAYSDKPSFDPGNVNLFVPDNIIIGDTGELQRPNGDFYKVDFEVNTIVLEIPNGLYDDERTLDIVNDFIASTVGDDGNLTGITKKGFKAMKFADCSYVSTSALTNDQLRFSVAVQSFSPNTNGLSEEGYGGAIVDGKMGVAVDYSTGLITLNFTNLYQDTVARTLSTKVQVSVYLKKGGFNNTPLFVESTKLQNMLGLISVFNSPSNTFGHLVDLTMDVTGILPIANGGTGLGTIGSSGKILVSDGYSLSYKSLFELPGFITSSTGSSDANKVPVTDGYGKLDPSFMYINPVHINGFSGVATTNFNTPTTIGAFTFNLNNYISTGLSSIKMEAILETTNPSYPAYIQIYSISSGSYINMSAGSTQLATTNTDISLVRSDDIKNYLMHGSDDFLYEIHLFTYDPSLATYATCKMARLTLNY